MKLILILTFVFSVSLCLGSPADTSLLVRQRRDIDLYANTRLIIQELLTNLRNAIAQAVNSITIFSSGLQDLGAQFRLKLEDDVATYRDRVREAIDNATGRFTSLGSGVRECIAEHRKEAEQVFTGIITNAKSCADDRIKEIAQMIIRLKDLTVNATKYVNHSLEEMHNCTKGDGGILSTGACLGGIAIRTEIKGAVFIAQSGLLIVRINLSLASLPSALEVCAGSSIVEAGIGAAKVIIEVGKCSVSSAYSSLSGNKTD